MSECQNGKSKNSIQPPKQRLENEGKPLALKEAICKTWPENLVQNIKIKIKK